MNIKSNFFFYFFILSIVFIIILLQYAFWFSDTGIIKYNELKKLVSHQSKYVHKKSETNIKLYSEVVLLRRNKEILQN